MKRYLIILCALLSVTMVYAEIYTIGTGYGSSSSAPFNGLYNYNWSKTVYTLDDINDAGLVQANQITGVAFDVASVDYNYTMLDQRIYVRHSNITNYELTDEFHPDSSDFQLCFQGTLNYVDEGWYYIEFSSPFSWNGTQGIEFLFENHNGAYDYGYPNFRQTNNDYYRMVTKAQDSAFPQGIDGRRYLSRPNIQLHTPLEVPPAAAQLLAPHDGAAYLPLNSILSWNRVYGATGYKLYLSTNNPPAFHSDLGDVDFVAPADLQQDSHYYWQIVPYNLNGDATDCLIWSFTTIAPDLVTIGDGEVNQYMPVNTFYGYSYAQSIYLQSQINVQSQRIEKISYYWNGVGAAPNSNAWTVYMGHTNKTVFLNTSDWVPYSQLFEVFSGTVDAGTNAGWITITLDSPFTYNNTDNLVIAVDENQAGYDNPTYFYFNTNTTGQNRSLRYYHDSNNPDPASPPTGNLTAAYPNLILQFGDLPDTPVFYYQPQSIDFGQVSQNVNYGPMDVTVTNTGGGTINLAATDISLIGSNASQFSFSSQNLPAALGAGESTVIPVYMTATSEGQLSAILRIVYNNQNYDVPLSASGLPYGTVIIGTGTLTTRFPLGSLAGYERSAALYTADEIGIGNKRINALAWYATEAFTASVPTKIYLKSVLETSLVVQNWASLISGAILVYDATMTPIAANNWKQVTLNSSFDLYNGDNLLVLVERNNGETGAGPPSSAPGISASAVANKHLTVVRDFEPPTGNCLMQSSRPNLKFLSANFNSTTPPNSAILVSPADQSELMPRLSTLNWSNGGGGTRGYKLYFGSTNPPEFVADLGDILSYDPGMLAPDSTYYWKLVPYNDFGDNLYCPVWSFSTVPLGTERIGTGSENEHMPVSAYYSYTYSQSIYPQSLISVPNMLIEKIAYQWNGEGVGTNSNIWTVYMGHTQQDSFDSTLGWIPVDEMQEVFSGTLNIPDEAGWIEIQLNTAFLYNNTDNLVIAVDENKASWDGRAQYFYNSPVSGAAPSLRYYSDTLNPSPEAAPAGTLVSAYPNLILTATRAGHIAGNITGENNQALAGVNIQFSPGGYSGTSDAQGHYNIPNIPPGAYIVSFSLHGYQNHSQPVTIVLDETFSCDVQLQPLPILNVNGNVYASDTSAGIGGALVALSGYEDYTVNTNANGSFQIAGVFGNSSYQYTVTAAGYSPLSGNINISSVNYDMGTLTLPEITYAPRNVVATASSANTSVDISWQEPDPDALEITESFEGEIFPPAGWMRTVTNNGAANAQGLFPTWCRVGSLNISGETVAPTEGSFQAGLIWDYGHQDEWLITPVFNCPVSAYLKFDSYVFLGSANQEHYYVKVSTDNGSSWTVLWDASAQTGGWNYYEEPISLDLSAYSEQPIKLAFHAVDGPDNSGLWYLWFIDNIYIGNSDTAIRFEADQLVSQSYGSSHSSFGAISPARENSRALQEGYTLDEPILKPSATAKGDRVLVGYKVWRLAAGQESNESAWNLVTPQVITELQLNDPGWASLPNGNYRWAVKAVYTSDLMSAASMSNILIRQVQNGMIGGSVRRLDDNTPIMGATVSAAGVTATTNSAGGYMLIVPVGSHEVSASAEGYYSQTIDDVIVVLNQTTTQNFLMIADDSDSADDLLPVTATELRSNYPNPFNPTTTFSYSIKESGPVKLEIYNIKGQLVKTLINAEQASGHYQATWNGRDSSGKSCASGVYYYRLSAQGYRQTRKMVLSQ